MVFPKKSRWNMIFLELSGKMIFLFPENMILFFRRKRKDDLSQKDYLEIRCFLYICINVKNLALPFCQKKKMCPRAEKIRLKVTFPASLKKIIFILENVVFLLKCHIDRSLRKGSRSSHRRCSIREGGVPGSLF